MGWGSGTYRKRLAEDNQRPQVEQWGGGLAHIVNVRGGPLCPAPPTTTTFRSDTGRDLL